MRGSVASAALFRGLAGVRPVDRLGAPERHTILRAARPGETRFHAAKIELELIGVAGRSCALVAPQALGSRIGAHELDALARAAGELEVAEGFRIDRKDAAGAAVFRRHVGDRRAVGERQVGEPVAEELDELVDHPFLSQHLGHGENEVGGGGARLQPPVEAKADHLRDQHGHGLPEHGCLGLDAADAPPEHP